MLYFLILVRSTMIFIESENERFIKGAEHRDIFILFIASLVFSSG